MITGMARSAKTKHQSPVMRCVLGWGSQLAAAAQETLRLRGAGRHWRKMGHPLPWGRGLGGTIPLAGTPLGIAAGVHHPPRKPPLAAEKAALVSASGETLAQPLGRDVTPKFLK